MITKYKTEDNRVFELTRLVRMHLQRLERTKLYGHNSENAIYSERARNHLLPHLNPLSDFRKPEKPSITPQMQAINKLYISPTHQQLFKSSQSQLNYPPNPLPRNALHTKLPLKRASFYGQKLTEDQKSPLLSTQKQFKKVQALVSNYNQDFSKFTPDQIPRVEPARFSQKKNGIIYSYAANTHQGNVRHYNEDRVSIILNMIKPEARKGEQEWPDCSYFAIYDGHGGTKCADFLRDQLHQMIIKDEDFLSQPKLAIARCIYKIEKLFFEASLKQNRSQQHDKSCLVLALFVNKKCYIANVGDSRALLFSSKKKLVTNLSRDHKPSIPVEKNRIIQNGGQIYQSYAKSANANGQPQVIYGPHRVFPGRLSVSRTIGDIDAKLQRFGGNSGCVVCQPEIKEIDITEEDDFLLLGCDGMFDKLENKDIIKSMLSTEISGKDVHQYTGLCVDQIIRDTLLSKSMDNLTVVLICFQNFHNVFNDLLQRGSKHLGMHKQIEEKEYEHDQDEHYLGPLKKDINIMFQKYGNRADAPQAEKLSTFQNAYDTFAQQNKKIY